MLSVLGVNLGPIAVGREEDDFFAGKITDLVIYEASRLMKKYPNLNSYYANGHIYRRETIVAGLAMDDGGRLVVYGIENAAEMDLRGLRSVIGDAVSRYIDNSLTAAELSRATFAVTDLSADELDFILPLLPVQQGVIIGVTRSSAKGFSLFAGFDHRITEGREVAAFLGELRERLLDFAEKTSAAAEPACAFCGKSAAEEVHRFKGRGLLKLVNAQGTDIYSCTACWIDF